MKRETKAEWHARIFGNRQPTRTLRVGHWIGANCGQKVYDKADPRHIGTVRAVIQGRVHVVFENGWHGEIDIQNCVNATEGERL